MRLRGSLLAMAILVSLGCGQRQGPVSGHAITPGRSPSISEPLSREELDSPVRLRGSDPASELLKTVRFRSIVRISYVVRPDGTVHGCEARASSPDDQAYLPEVCRLVAMRRYEPIPQPLAVEEQLGFKNLK